MHLRHPRSLLYARYLRLPHTRDRSMIQLGPTTLEGHGIRLEPLTLEHHDALREAGSDGRLWELWFTSVPEPERVAAYIEAALDGQHKGHMLPWAVRDLETGLI